MSASVALDRALGTHAGMPMSVLVGPTLENSAAKEAGSHVGWSDTATWLSDMALERTEYFGVVLMTMVLFDNHAKQRSCEHFVQTTPAWLHFLRH
jgi:hypothetical protein